MSRFWEKRKNELKERVAWILGGKNDKKIFTSVRLTLQLI